MSNAPLTRRAFLRASGLGLTVAALAACAPASSTTGGADDPFRPTDPATVSLAAGKPQFVEFFAFW